MTIRMVMMYLSSLKGSLRSIVQINKTAVGSQRLPSVRASALLMAPVFTSSMLMHEKHTSCPAASLYSQNASLTDALIGLKSNAKQVYHKARTSMTEYFKSEGGRTVMTIIALNTAVYAMWKVMPTSFMIRHFSNSLQSIRQARVWTSLTSNFSHMTLLHLTANMYVLSQFGIDVAEILGAERFFLFYSTAGVASSLASLGFRRLTSSSVISLGASGAVVATLWLHACFFPDRRMVLLGTDKSVTMQELVLAYAIFDAAGLLGSFGKIDFAAHLGGAIFANVWFQLVREKLVEEYVTRSNDSPSLFDRIRLIFMSRTDEDGETRSR